MTLKEKRGNADKNHRWVLPDSLKKKKKKILLGIPFPIISKQHDCNPTLPATFTNKREGTLRLHFSF